MKRTAGQPSDVWLYATAILGLSAVGLWIVGAAICWSFQIIRGHGDFRLMLASDAYEWRIGESHHAEEWHVAYWKLVALSAVPALWHLQFSVRHANRPDTST